MNNPGVYDLGDRTITTALTGEVITLNDDGDEFIEDLEGLLSANIQLKFSYGAGGTNCKAYVQTSLDQGTSWIDVICVLFELASETKIFNLSALTPKTTGVAPTDGSLTDDTSLDGVLGDMWRVKITSTGTYTTNTSVSVRMVAR
jgi:hypothetical protein